jgi:hypothetical protein
MISAELHDGEVLYFPNEMPEEEIDRLVYEHVQRKNGAAPIAKPIPLRVMINRGADGKARTYTVERTDGSTAYYIAQYDAAGRFVGVMLEGDGAASQDDRPFAHIAHDPSSPGDMYDLARLPNK